MPSIHTHDDLIMPSIHTHDDADPEYTRATPKSRLHATLLDIGSVILILIPLFITSINFTESNGSLLSEFDIWILFFLLPATLLALTALAIYNLFLLHKNGQTLGKKYLKIKIVRSNLYMPASLPRILFIRTLPIVLLTLIPYAGPFLALSTFTLIFRPQQRCLHDLLADTHVIQDTPTP